jgi:hypothetical protein
MSIFCLLQEHHLVDEPFLETMELFVVDEPSSPAKKKKRKNKLLASHGFLFCEGEDDHFNGIL